MNDDDVAEVELEADDGTLERFPFRALGRLDCSHCGRSCLGGYICLETSPLSAIELVRTLVIHDEPTCAGFELDERPAELILRQAALWPPPDLKLEKVIPS